VYPLSECSVPPPRDGFPQVLSPCRHGVEQVTAGRVAGHGLDAFSLFSSSSRSRRIAGPPQMDGLEPRESRLFFCRSPREARCR